jgi:hypothetical protein
MSRPDEPKDKFKDRPANKERDAVRFRINRMRKRIKGMAVTNIYQEGFPEGTPYKEAVLTATEHAKEQGIEGEVIQHERIQTDEHLEAGEFIIKLSFSTDPPPDPDAPVEPTDPGPKG